MFFLCGFVGTATKEINVAQGCWRIARELPFAYLAASTCKNASGAAAGGDKEKWKSENAIEAGIDSWTGR